MTRVFWVVVLLLVAVAGPSLLAQAVSPEARNMADAATADGPTSEWGSSVVWAFLSSSFLEYLKRNQKFAMLSERTTFWTQRALGVGLAVATAAGVHASFDAQAGVLTLSGLLWPSVWDGISESLRQFVHQEVLYRAAIKNYKGNEGK
jgi:hypothetical protein